MNTQEQLTLLGILESRRNYKYTNHNLTFWVLIITVFISAATHYHFTVVSWVCALLFLIEIILVLKTINKIKSIKTRITENKLSTIMSDVLAEIENL